LPAAQVVVLTNRQAAHRAVATPRLTTCRVDSANRSEVNLERLTCTQSCSETSLGYRISPFESPNFHWYSHWARRWLRAASVLCGLGIDGGYLEL